MLIAAPPMSTALGVSAFVLAATVGGMERLGEERHGRKSREVAGKRVGCERIRDEGGREISASERGCRAELVRAVASENLESPGRRQAENQEMMKADGASRNGNQCGARRSLPQSGWCRSPAALRRGNNVVTGPCRL